jgi:hydrogenase/urease accessory protein HupE
LHAIGLGLGSALKERAQAVRFAGGAVALAGALAFAL